MSTDSIIVEDTLNAPINKVWQALTDKSQMKQWYFDLDEFRTEEGFEFSFTGQGQSGDEYVHLCKITEIEPQKMLRHSWAYQGYSGISLISWELSEEDGKTRVRLIHQGVENFPADNPDFAKANFKGGWNHTVSKALKEFVEEG